MDVPRRTLPERTVRQPRRARRVCILRQIVITLNICICTAVLSNIAITRCSVITYVNDQPTRWRAAGGRGRGAPARWSRLRVGPRERGPCGRRWMRPRWGRAWAGSPARGVRATHVFCISVNAGLCSCQPTTPRWPPPPAPRVALSAGGAFVACVRAGSQCHPGRLCLRSRHALTRPELPATAVLWGKSFKGLWTVSAGLLPPSRPSGGATVVACNMTKSKCANEFPLDDINAATHLHPSPRART